MNGALRKAFATFAEAPAVLTQDGQSLDFDRFGQLVTSCAMAMEAGGVRPGQRVAPITGNLALRLALCVAVWRLGADVVLTEDPAWPMARGIVVDHVVADADQAVPAGPNRMTLGADWIAAPEGEGPADVPGGGVIFATSGSTGLPKYMQQSADIWYAQALGFLQLSGEGHGTSLITYPPTTSAFMMAAIMCLLTGHGICLPRGSVEETLAAALDFDATVLHAPPAVLQDVASAAEAGVRGPRFSYIRGVGGATGPQLLARLHALYGPVTTVVGGANETLLFSMGAHDGGPVPAGWAGTIFPHVIYELRDQHLYRDLGEGAGRIAVKVPPQMRVTGYIGGGPIYDAEGWVETGDIVAVDDAGTVRFLGRDDFVINIGGGKFAPELIEALAEAVPGVSAAAAAPIRGEEGDRLALLVILEAGGTLDAVRRRVLERIVDPSALELKAAARLPLLPSGKIDRPAVAEQAQRAG